MAKHCLILESLLSAASQETATEAAVCLKMRPKPFGKINNLVALTTGKHTNIVHVVTRSAGRERHTEHLLLLLFLNLVVNKNRDYNVVAVCDINCVSAALLKIGKIYVSGA